MGKNIRVNMFQSPYGCRTEDQALYVLDQLRRTHADEIEIRAGVKKIKGKWYAWRQSYKDTSLVING